MYGKDGYQAREKKQNESRMGFPCSRDRGACPRYVVVAEASAGVDTQTGADAVGTRVGGTTPVC